MIRSEMATAPQILANRANAQRSTGPQTAAGKAAVSQNATSHGLSSSQFALLPHNNPEEFHRLLDTLLQEFQPVSTTEEFLVTELARAQWKIGRIAHIEAALLAGPRRNQPRLTRGHPSLTRLPARPVTPS